VILSELLHSIELRLRDAGIESARLDAEILMCHALRLKPYQLITDSQCEPAKDAVDLCEKLFSRRIAGEPIAYITEKKEFYGLEFFVDRRVLIPRPDTEILVELALEHAPLNGRVLDICTGSGAVAISMKHERRDLIVTGTDISADAIAVAKINSQRLIGDEIRLIESNLFDAVRGERFDIITANPPYVDVLIRDSLQKELDHEPEIALFATENGMTVIKRIIDELPGILCPGSLFFMETGYNQGSKAAKLCTDRGLKCETKPDLSGNDRVAIIRR
jgi:release factor glutamine methyltransferase